MVVITRRWGEVSSPVEQKIIELSLPSGGPSHLSLMDPYHGTSSSLKGSLSG